MSLLVIGDGTLTQNKVQTLTQYLASLAFAFAFPAEAELKQLQELSGGTYLENDLLRHNLVVFRGGEHALQVCLCVALVSSVRGRTPVSVIKQTLIHMLTCLTFITCAQYLPPLGDVPPEARLNLVIHHLRHNDIGEALSLVKDLEPTSPQEYILKVSVSVCPVVCCTCVAV